MIRSEYIFMLLWIQWMPLICTITINVKNPKILWKSKNNQKKTLPIGGCIFQKGEGATITDEKKGLSSPVAMGDNGHWQPWSCLPAFIMAGELKIFATNLKSEENMNFLSCIFTDFNVCDQNCHDLLWFFLFLVSGIWLGKY